MNSIRVSVGVPKAGSAARSAEGETFDRRSASFAGSAARAAEEAKRQSGSGQWSAPPISMRAQGGKITRQPVVRAVTEMAEPTLSPAVAECSKESAVAATATSTEEHVLPGLLQHAAARVQLLARSLFRSGDRKS